MANLNVGCAAYFNTLKLGEQNSIWVINTEYSVVKRSSNKGIIAQVSPKTDF
jgi:hypothetical protein